MSERSQTSSQVKRCSRCGTEYPLSFNEPNCVHDGGAITVGNADKIIGSLIASRYVCSSLLGTGGWSSVYQGHDQQLNRPVAIKLLHGHINDNDRRQRFEREAKITSSLVHPNIATVFDYGVMPSGQPFIVMELLNGMTLASVFETQPQLSVKRTINIINQVCDALHHAHGHGVVHRDLKPENIMLVDGDFVKLMDFGLAKSMDGFSLTETGNTVGTPAYMSPEQCRGEQIDPRTDIYSLGAIMFRMLTGKPVFQANSLMEAMHRHVNEEPQTLAAARPDLYFPEAIAAAVARCLKKVPAERFTDCLELKEALAYGGNSTRSQEYLAHKQTGSKSAWTFAVLALTGALVIGAGVVMVLREHPPRSASSEPASPRNEAEQPAQSRSAGYQPAPVSSAQPSEHALPAPKVAPVKPKPAVVSKPVAETTSRKNVTATKPKIATRDATKDDTKPKFPAPVKPATVAVKADTPDAAPQPQPSATSQTKSTKSTDASSNGETAAGAETAAADGSEVPSIGHNAGRFGFRRMSDDQLQSFTQTLAQDNPMRLFNEGILCLRHNDKKGAEEKLLACCDLAEKQRSPRGAINGYCQLGSMYYRTGRRPAAKAMFEKMQAWRVPGRGPMTLQIAVAIHWLAKMHTEAGANKQAYAEAGEARDMFNELKLAHLAVYQENEDLLNRLRTLLGVGK